MSLRRNNGNTDHWNAAARFASPPARRGGKQVSAAGFPTSMETAGPPSGSIGETDGGNTGEPITGAPPANLKFLTLGIHALPPELHKQTVMLSPRPERWWEKLLRWSGLAGTADRSRSFRMAWSLFRAAPQFDAVITTGAMTGLVFAFLQKLRGSKRPVHVMYDCLWYGGNSLKRSWMRACLGQVNRCVVWASAERSRYAKVYELPADRFVFIPHHHSLLRYQFEIGDEGYLFAGGNADRDYGFFFEAVRELALPCLLATNRSKTLEGLQVPGNVRVVSATPGEFRQLMARARVVVMPMRATLLHAGAQQSILNAMYMGKPVVLTDPEGGADYIQHEKTGLLVEYLDVRTLRKAIQFLWEHPEEARAMGERAREAALPLTTERCNTEIWNLAMGILPTAKTPRGRAIRES